MNISPLSSKPAPHAMLVNVLRLITAYYVDVPDPSSPAQRVSSGTLGRLRPAFEGSL